MTELNLLGRTIGRFEILAELGRGGMAVVYRARQTDLERTVALKVLPPELSLNQDYIARFRQEARSAAGLEHPHIVPIYEVGTADGFQYIAMKYIAGRTLKDVVEEEGALGIPKAAALLEQVAAALDHAHSEGVIHRDIKPSNVMVAQNGWAYLADFGLARGSVTSGLTMAGTVMGTPEYMSPEQAQGLPTIGPPTDIYALGVVLYELLTGNMPFQADTPMGMLIARLQYSPRPPREYRGDLPEPVEDVIMRALARKPEARYASAGALVQALKRAAELRGQTFAPAQPPVSPPQGTPRAPSGPPISQPAGVLPAQLAGLKGGIAPTQPASPNGGALPTQPAGTPPYVIPAVGPTQAMPRMATPPHLPVANYPGAAAGATEIRAPQERPARSSRGLLLGIGAVVLLLVLAGGAFAFFQGRADPRIEQGLSDASAALEQKGGFDRALKAYSDVLAIDGQNVTAHSRRALILNLRGHYDEAEQAARAALAADPNAAQAHAMLAEALASQNDYEAALTSANSAISSGEQVSSGYNARATIRADRAVIESDEALLQQAEADAEKALTLADKEGNLAKSLAHRARGYVYWQEYSLKNDDAALDRGIEQFNRAVGLQGQIAEFHVDLGYFYDQQGERDRAREQFEAALDIDPGYGHLHAGLGWNLYYLGDYDGALNEFDQALALSPQDVDAMIGRSRVFQYRSEPDYDAAIAALDQAAKAAPKSTVLFSYLGWAYRSKAIELEYASEEQRSVYSEAEYHFREALKRNEKYYDALTGLGWVLQEQGDILQDTALYDEAISILQQSLDLRDDQAYAHVALGWSLYGQQKYDEAATAFEQATVELDTYAYAYYGLGRAREAQGQTDQAQQAYQTAVANGSTQAQDALAKLK